MALHITLTLSGVVTIFCVVIRMTPKEDIRKSSTEVVRTAHTPITRPSIDAVLPWFRIRYSNHIRGTDEEPVPLRSGNRMSGELALNLHK